VERTHELEEAADAVTEIESGQARGKLVVIGSPPSVMRFT
jgi:Zinc-binding dehydrogenase